MRTSSTLLTQKTYQNGLQVYYGDPSRLYSSELILTVNMAIVKSPEGSRVMTKSDDQLIAAMHKLKFGQIGAVKSGVTVAASETLVEVLVPVSFQEVVPVEKKLEAFLDLDSYMSKKTITFSNGPMTLDKVKDYLAQFRNANSQIRKGWAKKAEMLRDRGVKAESILKEKASSYSDYVSITEYGIAMNVSIAHYVNKPELKAMVVENCDNATYAAYNYKETKVRKVAVYRGPVVSIPIQNLEDRDSLLQAVKQLIQPDRLKSIHPKAEQLIIEGSPLNSQNVDFADLKKRDAAVKKT